MRIYLDIETRPCDDPDLIAELVADIRPPGSMKRADTIAEWERTERPQREQEVIARTSLDGAYGRVCIIGWAINNQEPQAIVSADEASLLHAFFGEIQLATASPSVGLVRWVGHNLYGFDLPFLRKRAMLLGITPPFHLRNAMMARQWDASIADTMLMWDSRQEARISLDRLCRLFHLPSPKAGGIDGSKVAELFAAGEYELLGEYCRADVESTRRVYRALTWAE